MMRIMTVMQANEELLHGLNVLFQEIREDKKLQIEIDNQLVEHNFRRGTLNEVMLNPERIFSFETVEAAAFINSIYKVTKRHEINPQKYFSAKDIKKAEKYTRNKVEFEYPYTLHRVIKASDTEYATVMSAKEIAAWWNNEALTYNFQTQRLSKKKINKEGKVIEKPDVRIKSVKRITELMLSGRYKSNALLFNILVDGNDNIEYDDGELTIYEGTTVNLIDGMHRVQAMLNALEENPDFDRNFIVAITHLPISEAQDLLSQVNTTNRFDATLAKYYGANKLGEQIAKDLMNIPELIGRVSIKTTLDKKLSYLTNFAVLSEAIEDVFKPQTTKDRYDILEVLKKFFGYLINAYEFEFVKNVDEVRKISWINHHNTFVGYVALAKKLYEKYGFDFPVNKITDAVNSIDFRKQEGLPFNNIMAPQGKVNSNVIKRNIKEFFEKIDV